MPTPDVNRLIGLYNQGNMASVLQLGGQALARQPDAIAVHSIMGAASAALGRIDQAVLHFRKVADLNPKDPAAHNNQQASPKPYP